MPADLILNDDTIELVDARLVTVTDEDGDVLLRITGRLRASDSVTAREVTAEHVEIGTGGPGETDPPVVLRVGDGGIGIAFEVQSTPGQAIVRVGGGEVKGDLRVQGDGALLMSPEARIASLDGQVITVGGRPGETAPADAEVGVVRLLNHEGNESVEIDAGSTDVHQPSIKVRWERIELPRPSRLKFNNPRLSLGAGLSMIGSGGRRRDVEEADDESVDTVEVEIDLVQEVLALREAVSDLTRKVEELESGG